MPRRGDSLMFPTWWGRGGAGQAAWGTRALSGMTQEHLLGTGREVTGQDQALPTANLPLPGPRVKLADADILPGNQLTWENAKPG